MEFTEFGNKSSKVDGAYGSSLGGSFVGLLVQRKRIHIDHAFIGISVDGTTVQYHLCKADG